MLYVDIPTLSEVKVAAAQRSDMCVSIYLPTTPLTQETAASRIALKNLVGEAIETLTRSNADKRRIELLHEHLSELADDDEMWRLQARSLAILATPDVIRSYRLPNHLVPIVEVSDRFHLKPLLRAIAFPNRAFVLALSQAAIRVVEVHADLPPHVVKLGDLPKDAASAVGRASVRDRSPSGRIHGNEGQKVLLRQYARSVDAALRGLLAGRDTPLILAAAEPIASLYRSVNTYPFLADAGIAGAPDRVSDHDLATAARPILDGLYAEEVRRLNALYATRAGQNRATTDMSDAARAATFGAIDVLLVDMDEVVPGTVDETDGSITFADGKSSGTYGIVDEIACRALATGARVLSVRKQDIPQGASLAAILRQPL